MRGWLKNKRDKADLTQEQVADYSGISRSYYTNIENSTKTPSVEVAKSIAHVLKFEWELFFEDKCSFKEHLIVAN